MAVLRRSVVAEPPAMLRAFDPADWPSADAEAAFQEWKQARREWISEHPDSSLGDMLDLLRGERRARLAQWCPGWNGS
jgi:hypothetical protein